MITTSEYKWTGFISVTLASNKKTFCLFILDVAATASFRLMGVRGVYEVYTLPLTPKFGGFLVTVSSKKF